MECQPRRQGKIWQNWKFLCQCDRCRDPTEFGTYFSGIRCAKCPDGIQLPLVPEMLGTPWKCSGCGAKCGSGQITERLRDYEALIRDFQGQDVEILVTELRNHLSPNHLFLVALREQQLFTRLSADTRCQSGLLKRIKLGEELVNLLDKIDPGYTTRKGKLFQVLAKDRFCLSKIQLSGSGQEEEGKKSLQRATAELKIATMCLKYS